MGVKNLIKMNNKRPTPITDDTFDAYYRSACGTADLRDKMEKLERERDEAREKLSACAINTNVRLFDLVRYMRSELHEAQLITDKEYFWLCAESEMAHSPKGGSPSPRRLEDYDKLREQMDAMRGAIKEAHKTVTFLNDFHSYGQSVMANATLAKLQPFITP